MTRFLALVLVCLMTACGTPDPNTRIIPVDAGHALALPGSKAVVVTGIEVDNPSRTRLFGIPIVTTINWIAVDPITRLRVGTAMPSMESGCLLGSDCDGGIGSGTRYVAFVLEPGTYALGYVAGGTGVAMPSAFTQLSTGGSGHTASLEARAQAMAPEFELAAGEVVYAGDLVFDFGSQGWLAWSLQRNEAAARAYLAGTGLADHMLTRLMRRADGSPIRTPDGSPIVGRTGGTITLVPNDPLPGAR